MRVALRSGTLLLLLHHVGGVKPGASHPTPLLYMRSPRWTEKPVTHAPLHQHGDVWNPEASLGRSDTPRPMPSPRQQAATLPWRQDAYSTASPYPWPVSFPTPFIPIGRKALKAVTVCLVLQSVNLSLSDLPRWRACSGDARGPCSVLGREGGRRNPGPARPNASPTRKNGKT